MKDILKIVTSLVFGRILIPKTMDLGKSGHTRSHAESLAMPVAVMPDFVRSLRPGAHKTHLPAKHIPQLRQFGETGLLHDELMKWQANRVPVGVQAVHGECLPMLPAASLRAERFTLANFEPCRNRQYCRPGDEQQEGREDQVECTLPGWSSLNGGRGSQFQQRQAVQVEKLGLRKIKLVRLWNQADSDAFTPTAGDQIGYLRMLGARNGDDQIVDTAGPQQLRNPDAADVYRWGGGGFKN